MKAMRIGVAMCAVVLLVVSKSAAASIIPLGSKGTGAIDAPGEVDAWILPVVKGTSITFKVHGKKGLHPQVALFHVDSGLGINLTDSWTDVGLSTVGVKQLPITVTEWLRLEVSGGDTTGEYGLTTGSKTPKSLTKFDMSSSEPGLLGIIEFAFDAPPGSILQATFTQKDSRSAPTILGVEGPGGPLIIVPSTNSKGSKTTLKSLLLKDLGAYKLSVVPSGSVASLKAKIKVKPPKKPKKTVLEGTDPGVTGAIGKYLASDGLPGHGIDDLAAAIVQAYALSQDPSGDIDGVRASLLQGIVTKSDVKQLLELSAAGSPVVTIPIEPGPSPADGSLADCGTPTVVYYVNGVLSDKVSALHSTALLSALVRKAAPDLGKDLQFRLCYNPSGLDGAVIDGLCGALLDVLAAIEEESGWEGLIDDALVATATKFQQICTSALGSLPVDVVIDLLLESPVEWALQLFTKPGAGDVVEGFADLLRSDISSGRTVVIVAHSQGNFVTSAALAELSIEERGAVGVVAVASPGYYPQFESYGAFVHYTLLDDIILLVPGALAPNVTNLLSQKALCSGNPFPLLTLPVCLVQAVGIHGFDGSYLKYSASQESIVQAVLVEATGLANPQAPIGQGYLQVTLTWNIPGDIDLHIFEPTGKHVWYADQQGDVGEIDVDDIPGDGPENYFVCKQSDLLPGSYSVYVNNFNGTTGTHCVVAVHAGDQFATFQATVGEADQGATLIPVASIQYSSDGTFSMSAN